MKLLFKYPDETVDKNDETFKYYQQQALKVAGCGVDELESFKVYEDDENSDKVSIDVTSKSRRFERIRRITGYLTGTVDRWNDAKRAELNDRVKHV